MLDVHRGLFAENGRLRKVESDQAELIDRLRLENESLRLELEQVHRAWVADVALMGAMKKELEEKNNAKS